MAGVRSPAHGSNVDSAYANIDLLRRLTHANIVQYHGHFTQYVGGVRCLCMEYAPALVLRSALPYHSLIWC